MKKNAKPKTPKPEPTTLDIAAGWAYELGQTARLAVALRKEFHPCCRVLWRMAGKTPDGSPGVALVVIHPDGGPVFNMISQGKLKALAAEVTHEEVKAELLRWSAR